LFKKRLRSLPGGRRTVNDQGIQGKAEKKLREETSVFQRKTKKPEKGKDDKRE